MLTPGNRTADFTLPDIRGGSRCLADFLSAGPLWLIVVKGSCPTCRLVAPLAERIHRAFLPGPAVRAPAGAPTFQRPPEGPARDHPPEAPASVVLVIQGPPEEAREFVEDLGLTMTALVEESPWPVSQALGLTVVPAFFLIGSDGVVSMSGEGFLRSEWEAVAAFSLIGPGEDFPLLRPG